MDNLSTICGIIFVASMLFNIIAGFTILCQRIDIRHNKMRINTLEIDLEEANKQKKLANDELYKKISNDARLGDRHGLK